MWCDCDARREAGEGGNGTGRHTHWLHASWSLYSTFSCFFFCLFLFPVFVASPLASSHIGFSRWRGRNEALIGWWWLSVGKCQFILFSSCLVCVSGKHSDETGWRWWWRRRVV
ncbi:hypothetical protein B0T25DRAFT_150077 [Lasiosphaeria hispida]|uniref:Uncharacterized protein n=1 Tax=Lasiosphaeria hispida TaxID=260671 RepID=A0AAJ0MFX6_9PEZI|nr:hypothetical protein B0T25DRAFT_150077 [Lasiosphaeria hispida]